MLDSVSNSRGQKMNTNFFSSNFSGTTGISQQNPRMSRQKSLISLASRDIPNFLAPTPLCRRPLPHRKISGLKSLGLCSVFVFETSACRRNPLTQSHVMTCRKRLCFGVRAQTLAFWGFACWTHQASGKANRGRRMSIDERTQDNKHTKFEIIFL